MENIQLFNIIEFSYSSSIKKKLFKDCNKIDLKISLYYMINNKTKVSIKHAPIA